MSGLRIWQLMAAIVAAAVLFVAVKLDEGPTSCTPLSPILAVSYICGGLGLAGARWRGRKARTGLILGLLLGPIGVLVACSNKAPDGWPERSRKSIDHCRRAAESGR